MLGYLSSLFWIAAIFTLIWHWPYLHDPVAIMLAFTFLPLLILGIITQVFAILGFWNADA